MNDNITCIEDFDLLVKERINKIQINLRIEQDRINLICTNRLEAIEYCQKRKNKILKKIKDYPAFYRVSFDEGSIILNELDIEPFKEYLLKYSLQIIENLSNFLKDKKTLKNEKEVCILELEKEQVNLKNNISECLNDIENSTLIQFYNSVINDISTVKKEDQKYSMHEIALKYIYEGLTITKNNQNEIAEYYGYKSGQSLKDEYDELLKVENRITNRNTQRKIKFSIDRIKNILPILSKSAKIEAEKDLDKLEYNRF